MKPGLAPNVRQIIKSFLPNFVLEFRRRRWVARKQRYALRVIRQFHEVYYYGAGSHGLEGENLIHSTLFLGVPALKCPLDCWIYQEIINKTKPDVIVETGVCYGGATLYLASMLDLLGNGGSVLGIDIDLSKVHEKVRQHPRIKLHEGSSVDPIIFKTIQQQCAGRRVMVILDSDHSSEHVLKELTLYGHLVSPGCYMICEDTDLNGHPVFSPVPYNPGPWEAVESFISVYGNAWFVDKQCEKFLMTCNPGGYLLKK